MVLGGAPADTQGLADVGLEAPSASRPNTSSSRGLRAGRAGSAEWAEAYLGAGAAWNLVDFPNGAVRDALATMMTVHVVGSSPGAMRWARSAGWRLAERCN